MIGGFNVVKIPLTAEQVEKPLAWRDQHNDLVRAPVLPFPECSILPENGMKIRIEQDETLKSVYHFTVTDTNAHKVKGRFTCVAKTGYVWKGSPELSYNDTQTAITVWATVSAYIVNFQPELVEAEQKEPKSNGASVHKASAKAANKAADRVIYLRPIVFMPERESLVKRKYTPCENAFSVRGHYRHYKSGKVVYVQPYEKNVGKEKDKRNKVLKIGEV